MKTKLFQEIVELYRQFCSHWKSLKKPDKRTSLIELSAVLGGVFTRLHGAGLVASTALQIAAFTSLTGASDHICVAASFVSSVVQTSQFFMGLFLIGGAFSLLAASILRIVRFCRNFGKERNGNIIVNLGKVLDGLSDNAAALIGWLQFALIGVSLAFLIAAIHTVVFTTILTPNGILQDWSHFENSCGAGRPH